MNTMTILFANVLLLLFLQFALPAASPHTLSLPNILSFKSTCSLPRSSQSAILDPILISKNGNFAWGFTSSPADGLPFCSLSIVCYHCKRHYPVWSASSHHTGALVSGAHILQLGTTMDLELRDASASLLWSTVAGGVASIELLDVGSLLMLDSANSTVWQSFDHPSNVLLPGQILTPGMRLVAGDYSAVLEAGGLALYVNSPHPLPYLVLNSSWGLSILDNILHPSCKGFSLVYATKGDVLTMELNLRNGSAAPGCSSYNYVSAKNAIAKSNLSVTTSSNSSGFRYLKLESNGEFKTFLDDRPDFSWFLQTDDTQGRGLCNLPNYCGEYSVCVGVGLCGCADPKSNQSTDYFISPDYTEVPPETDSCTTIQPVNCSTQKSTDAVKILQLHDLDYFPHRYISAPSNLSTSLHDCVQSCVENCSCVVAFYNNQTRACHQYSNALSMQRSMIPGSFLAFVKIVPHLAGPAHVLNFVVIIVTVGTSLLVGSLIFIRLWVRRKYGKSSRDDGLTSMSRSEDDTFLDSMPGLPPRYSVEQLQQITNGFSVVLGAGGFGSVYEGTLPDGTKIAVKKLEGAGQGVKEFRAEVAALAGVSHVNLVQLRGFCAEGVHRMLVYEHLANGSLDKWLCSSAESEPATLLDWQTRFRIAIDAARGLAFLHGESRAKIFHLDVKPQNLLLDDKFKAKLSDFGLAKLMERGRNSTMTSMRGTPGYLAPEWLLQTSVTDKSDVYSFGMLLMEVVSGRRNVDYSSLSEKWYWPAWVVKKVKEGAWEEVLEEAGRSGCERNDGDLQDEEAIRAVKVALWCVQEDPKTRPSMAIVLRMLEGHVEVGYPPLNMQLTLESDAKLLAHLRAAATDVSSSSL